MRTRLQRLVLLTASMLIMRSALAAQPPTDGLAVTILRAAIAEATKDGTRDQPVFANLASFAPASSRADEVANPAALEGVLQQPDADAELESVKVCDLRNGRCRVRDNGIHIELLSVAVEGTTAVARVRSRVSTPGALTGSLCPREIDFSFE